jgi:folate-binding Fe-S cluster repair protein YgfZ
MSNSLYASECYFMSAWTSLKISGADGVDFLNRLLTLDIHHLEIGHGSWAFLLDHRGRVVETIFLLREAVDQFIAVSETGADSLYQSLDKFLFAEAIELILLEAHICIYLKGSFDDLHLTNGFKIDLFGSSDEGLLIVESQDREAMVTQLNSWGGVELDVHHFEALRLSVAGALPSQEYNNISPLDVSLKGVSEGKGCYPGQEVIERTLALGKPARVTKGIQLIGSLERLTELIEAFDGEVEVIEQVVDSQDQSQEAVFKSMGYLTSITPLSCIEIGGEEEMSMDPVDASIKAIAQVKRKVTFSTKVYLRVGTAIYRDIDVVFG